MPAFKYARFALDKCARREYHPAIMIFLIALILVVGALLSIAHSNSKSLKLQKHQAEQGRIAEMARARREAGLPSYDRRGPLAKLFGVKAAK